MTTRVTKMQAKTWRGICNLYATAPVSNRRLVVEIGGCASDVSRRLEVLEAHGLIAERPRAAGGRAIFGAVVPVPGVAIDRAGRVWREVLRDEEEAEVRRPQSQAAGHADEGAEVATQSPPLATFAPRIGRAPVGVAS